MRRTIITIQALFTACLLLVQPAPGVAQTASNGSGETGRLVGKVFDASTGRPLTSVQVFVQDGSIGGLTDIDGRYILDGIPVGGITLTVQLIGYATKTVTGVAIEPTTQTLDITLDESAVELEGMTVSAERERGSQAFLLDSRRTAVSMVESVGATEIARRPDAV